MENLTLVIPAKFEASTLPTVLKEIEKLNLSCKKIIVVPKYDKETLKALENLDCKILIQKGEGFGNALIQGLNSSTTEYSCIFNADGSFDPKELSTMQKKINEDGFDLVFGSRYESDCSSEDDTWVTYIGNFIFSKIGNIFFNLNISDILYTYVAGKTSSVVQLNLQKKDFVFCVELPIKAKRQNLRITTSKSNERARIGGKKKVNAIKDGFLILIAMIKLFFIKN